MGLNPFSHNFWDKKNKNENVVLNDIWLIGGMGNVPGSRILMKQKPCESEEKK